MAQDQNWWESDPIVATPDQTTGSGSIYVPPAPEKPDLPAPTRDTESWVRMTPEEVQSSGLNPAQPYQRNRAGKIEPIGGSTAPQVDPNRPIQIKSALDALLNVRKLAQKTLSVGTQAERVSNYPVIGGLLGQNRADLEASLSLIEGNLIQDQLARLAKMNPGGMASLANSETEARRLASAIANLDPNQSESEFLRGVERAENYYREQAKQLGIELPAIPAQTGQQGAGPSITVTPKQSIQAWGQLTYDDKGQLVGDGYTGEAFDAAGNSLGLIGSVSEEALQQPAPSFYEGAINAVTGGDQSTATTERLPDWVEMPGINDLLSSAAWKTGLGTVFGGSPQEIAQIVQSNFPGTQVWQDEKGNYILRSATDGKDYAIKPGFQVSDIPRAVSTIGLGMLGGGGAGATALRTGAREAGIQAGVEGVQSATGGTFNTSDIAAAGVLGAGGQKATDVFLPKVVQGVNAIRRGNIPPDGGVPPAGGMGGGPSGGTTFDLPGGIQLPGGRVSPAPQGAMPTGGAPAQNMGAMADETFTPTTTTFRSGGAAGASDEGIRVTRAQELPVPIELARFQRSRLFEEQQRARDLAKNNEVGGPIRELLKEQQDKLRQNFDAFLDQTGAREWGNRREQGMVVDDALRTLAKRMNNKVNALYKRAEKSGELAEPVDMGGLADELNNLRAERTAAPVIKGIADELAVRELATGSLENGTLQMKRPLTLNEAEELRKKVNRVAKQNDPNDLRVGAELKSLIDSLTENSGGEAYKAARAARKEVGDKFERVSLVKKLIGMKPGTTDRQVALENVVETAVTSGGTSLDDIKALKSVLDEAGPRGQRAWRELQGATLEHIQNKAYRSQTDESGQRVLFPSQLEKAIADLDKGGKLDFVFDKRTAELLRTMGEVSKDLFTAPPGSVNSSNTASAMTNAMDTLVTFMLSGAPIPAGKVSSSLINSLRSRGLRKEVKRLVSTEQN